MICGVFYYDFGFFRAISRKRERESLPELKINKKTEWLIKNEMPNKKTKLNLKMKEPPGDTHSDGSFIVYEMETGQKMGEKRPKMPENPQKCKKISTTILSKSSC